ncbi:MAG: hypothetical protein WBA13_19355 [Microcoleaceae cyanobacterium]
MKNIIEPTIFLYLYDLKQAFGDNCENKDERFAQFVEKLPYELQKELGSQENKNIEFNAAFDLKEYQELYSDPNLPLNHFFKTSLIDKKNQYQGKGWYYPIFIFDTYALLIAVSIGASDEAVKPFKTLKEELKQRLNHQTGNLGRTWKLSGILPPTEGEIIISAEKYAKAYYQEFLPDNKWQQDYFGEGLFLGSPIFELNLTQQNHTIITFFSEQEAYEIDNNKYYDDWIRLFSFHHKIIWLYQTIEAVSNQTQEFYSKWENIRTSLHQQLSKQENLKVLRKTLKDAQKLQGEYRKNLYHIKFLKKAMEINLGNYIERLQLIEDKASQELIKGQQRHTDLSFLNQFAERVENKFLRQTNKNYKFLKLGLNFLESQMSDIRDRLAIERAERDRNFQDIIVTAGAGWAVGSLVQSVEFGKLEKEVGYRPFLPDSWPNPAAQLFFAIASASLSAVIVWLVIYLWRNHNDKK